MTYFSTFSPKKSIFVIAVIVCSAMGLEAQVLVPCSGNNSVVCGGNLIGGDGIHSKTAEAVRD